MQNFGNFIKFREDFVLDAVSNYNLSKNYYSF